MRWDRMWFYSCAWRDCVVLESILVDDQGLGAPRFNDQVQYKAIVQSRELARKCRLESGFEATIAI